MSLYMLPSGLWLYRQKFTPWFRVCINTIFRSLRLLVNKEILSPYKWKDELSGHNIQLCLMPLCFLEVVSLAECSDSFIGLEDELFRYIEFVLQPRAIWRDAGLWADKM